jgi:hypothetical protein
LIHNHEMAGAGRPDAAKVPLPRERFVARLNGLAGGTARGERALPAEASQDAAIWAAVRQRCWVTSGQPYLSVCVPRVRLALGEMSNVGLLGRA